ncbi:MAG: hypothetical protein LRY69_05165, partial [Gammaproteobacteria bacterium]|nr:hypothetical protein [Gammaproteobacteria bacterium]
RKILRDKKLEIVADAQQIIEFPNENNCNALPLKNFQEYVKKNKNTITQPSDQGCIAVFFGSKTNDTYWEFYRDARGSNSINPPINTNNIDTIKTALVAAVDKYIKWSADKNTDNSHIRGKNGFFTCYRHTEKGVENAQKLKENIKDSYSPTQLTEYIDTFLSRYKRLGGKYNTHSCASFILDALAKACPNSSWQELSEKTTSPHIVSP